MSLLYVVTYKNIVTKLGTLQNKIASLKHKQKLFFNQNIQVEPWHNNQYTYCVNCNTPVILLLIFTISTPHLKESVRLPDRVTDALRPSNNKDVWCTSSRGISRICPKFLASINWLFEVLFAKFTSFSARYRVVKSKYTLMHNNYNCKFSGYRVGQEGLWFTCVTIQSIKC